MARQVLIVGAGITGTCLARELSAPDDVSVTVLERDGARPRGSTTLAPGFVGLHNDAAVLTALAQSSAGIYDDAGSGFARSGGIELATSRAGAHEVDRRVEAARQADLHAHLLAAKQLPEVVGVFVDTTPLSAGHVQGRQ